MRVEVPAEPWLMVRLLGEPEIAKLVGSTTTSRKVVADRVPEDPVMVM